VTDARTTREFLEVLADEDPNVNVTRATLELLADNDPDVRVSRVSLMVLHSTAAHSGDDGSGDSPDSGDGDSEEDGSSSVLVPVSFNRVSRDSQTQQFVYGEATTKPFVGFEHLSEKPDGWQYEVKRWCSPFDLKLPHLPRLFNQSTQGIKESDYFKPGVGDIDEKDLLLWQFAEISSEGTTQWIPEIVDGYYYRYQTEYFYYGDNSRVQYIDPSDNVDGRNVVLLDTRVYLGKPILAASFRRHPTNRTVSYREQAVQRAEFTGQYSGGAELDTVTDVGKILWANVDTTKKEFVADTSTSDSIYLRFNRDYVKTYGVVPTVYADLGACEFLGISDGADYQVFYAENFPIIPDSSYHVYIVDKVAGTWSEATRVDTYFELLSSPSYPGIRYFVDRDFNIVHFGGAAEGGAPPLGTEIVVTYRTTLRIEYEEEDKGIKISALDANTNPISQNVHQGFVCITHENLDPTKIVLNVDKDRIPFASPIEYGPVTVGSDHAILEATVSNISGVAVPGVTVSFIMDPTNMGYINGSTQSSSVTNGVGKAFSSYQPPSSADSLGYYSVVVRDCTYGSYTSHKEVIISDSLAQIEGKESDTYIYQVLKDDLALGKESFDDWLYYEVDTPAWVQDSDDYAKWKAEFIEQYNIELWTGLVNGKLNGRKVVIYQAVLDTDALDPTDGSIGAYVPLRPELIQKISDSTDPYDGMYRLIYPAAAITDPDPDDSNVNVGGYFIVVPRIVRFKAYCWSSYYNRNIYSNEINCRVSLPNYLLGEYINENLDKIPFGWKLPISTDSVAAGLDGATFITINPRTGTYPVIDLVGGTGPTGDYVEDPY
jgi:hypothetical protein